MADLSKTLLTALVCSILYAAPSTVLADPKPGGRSTEGRIVLEDPMDSPDSVLDTPSSDPPTKYFDRVIPGVMEYRLEPASSRPLRRGEEILIQFTLTNRGDSPLEVCVDCVGSSIQVVPIRSGREDEPRAWGGILGSYFIEGVSDVRQLAPGESVTRTLDVSVVDCLRHGDGRFELNDSYCYRGKLPKTNEPFEYCVRGGPVTIDVRK